MKELFGVKNALTMTSGMAALVSGLTALGIGPGNQVIVPAYTYIATAMAVVVVDAAVIAVSFTVFGRTELALYGIIALICPFCIPTVSLPFLR